MPEVLEYLVLESIAQGYNEPRKIAELLNAELDEVLRVLTSLEARGLVTIVRKGLFAKRTAYVLTSKGLEVLMEERERVRDRVKEAERLARIGREEEARELVEPYLTILPLLIATGIVETMLLADLIGLEDVETGVEGVEDFDVGL